MTDIIIESVGKNFAKTNGVLLKQTADTALMFFPEVHPGGVRGNLIRFKKERGKDWEEIKEHDFRKLKLFEGSNIELGTEQLKKLLDEVEKRKLILETDGVQHGRTEYSIAEKSSLLIVNDDNIKDILLQLLEDRYSNSFWDMLKDAKPDLADKLTAGHLQYQRKKTIDTLKTRLTQSHAETRGDDSWQSWIYKNNWLFGATYKSPIEKQRINISGIMPDYLFPTLDDFIDILEIKLPDAEVIIEDKGHKGSWYWSSTTNEAIGQVINYLNEIDRLRLEIERSIKAHYGIDVLMLKPRAYILIGKSDEWSLEKKEGLRRLNHALHGVEIITYSDLVNRGMTYIDSSVGAHNE